MRASGSLATALTIAIVMCAPGVALGEEKVVAVEIGASQHLKVGESITRVSVGAADVADVAAFPPDQLLVTGKRIGQTTATVWTRGDVVTLYTIRVGYPLAHMTQELRKAIPDGDKLEVAAAGASLVLRGGVRDAGDVERAEELLRGFAAASAPLGGDPPPVLNMLGVIGDLQVQLEVSFAEVSRTALKEVGLNFWHKGKNGDYTGGLIGPGSTTTGIVPDLDPQTNPDTLNVAGGLPIISSPMAGAFGLVFSGGGSDFPFSAALNVLSSRGYARTLSEPTLVAMSGEEATFLAGGEFPVPMPQALGQIGVEYKKFGVQLKFIPTVVGDTIQLRLAATVSDIDFALGLRLAAVTVPGLTERHSETTVRLRDGQSFAIAGLLSDRVRSNVDKVPLLGDLPVLGALFRSTSYRREETELLVIVTARLARPQSDRPALPGQDTTTDPSDLELFLLGTIESKTTPKGRVGFSR